VSNGLDQKRVFKVNFKDKTFEITGKFKDVVNGFPNQKKDRYPHNHFIITVKNQDGIKIRFNFYGSYVDYLNKKKTLDENDLRDAFMSFLDDIICYLDYPNEEDFLNAFGFECIEGLRIFRECKKQLKKAQKLGLTEDEIYELLNELRELD